MSNLFCMILDPTPMWALEIALVQALRSTFHYSCCIIPLNLQNDLPIKTQLLQPIRRTLYWTNLESCIATQTQSGMMSRNLMNYSALFLLIQLVSCKLCTDEVCCTPECGKCGGPGCGSRTGGPSECCSSHILNSGRDCSKDKPPCVRLQSSASAPSSTLSNSAGTGNERICRSGVCCPSICRQCAGPGCGSRPGGKNNCCAKVIAKTKRSCTIHPPPCVVPVEPGPTCISKVCCGKNCGRCGGEGCSIRPGGKLECCMSHILEHQPKCSKSRKFACVL